MDDGDSASQLTCFVSRSVSIATVYFIHISYGLCTIAQAMLQEYEDLSVRFMEKANAHAMILEQHVARIPMHSRGRKCESPLFADGDIYNNCTMASDPASPLGGMQ
jgi:hypothetical protein